MKNTLENATEFMKRKLANHLQGGDARQKEIARTMFETKSVHRHEKDLKWDDFTNTENTPTEPLLVEGLDTVAAGRCEWCNANKENKYGLCIECGRFPNIARSSHEGQP